MAETCIVTRTGSSATVVLPAAWRKRNHVSFGDILEVTMSVDGEITFRKPSQDDRRQRVDDLLALVDSLPQVPWTRGDSPEDDRELLGERYV